MQIGKYEVKRVLAEGLFANVYEAREPEPPLGLGRRVVVKVCSTGDESVRRRFALETQMIAKLGDHANITSAYDMGFEGQSPYLVEEYISGEDLRHKIARRDDIPLAKKVEYLLQLAKGLQFAHSKGIVHRDIKPENVRIAEDGHVKIMDFGIGKVIASEATRLTASGAIVGTLGYLSPEQIRGEADERSDVFAFAVVAYELLTYEHPFPATSLREQLQIVMTSDPRPVRELFADCPADLAALIGRGLDKEPDRRPQQFGEIVDRLRRILARLRREAEPTPAAPTVVLAGEELEAALRSAEARAEARAAAGQPPVAAAPEPSTGARGDSTAAADEVRARTAVTPASPAAPSAIGARLGALGRRLARLATAAGSGLGAALAAAPRALARGAAALPALGSRLSWTPRWALLTGGVVVIGVVGFAVAFLAGRVSSPPRQPPPEVAVRQGPSEAPPPPLAATGTVFVDAFPWARVERVEALAALAPDDEEGLEAAVVDGVGPCLTPCSVELEAGSYRFVLSYSETPEREEACSVEVVAGETAECRARFAELTPVEYFQRMGWWD